MLREIRQGLLAIVAVVLGTQVSAFTNEPEWLNLSDQDLKAYAYDLIERRPGMSALDPNGLVYAYGNDNDEAKIGSALKDTYSSRNNDNIKSNASLALTTDNRCLVTGLTRGEAEFVEKLTQQEYHVEGRWLPPGLTHTSTEIYSTTDRSERCQRLRKNADKAVSMRTAGEKSLMEGIDVQLHGRNLITPYEAKSVIRAAANTNSAPTSLALRGFEAVDKVVTLPERTILAIVKSVLMKFAPWLLTAIVGFLAVLTVPWIAAVLAPVLIVLTIVDYALLGWMVMPFLWSLVTAII